MVSLDNNCNRWRASLQARATQTAPGSAQGAAFSGLAAKWDTKASRRPACQQYTIAAQVRAAGRQACHAGSSAGASCACLDRPSKGHAWDDARVGERPPHHARRGGWRVWRAWRRRGVGGAHALVVHSQLLGHLGTARIPKVRLISWNGQASLALPQVILAVFPQHTAEAAARAALAEWHERDGSSLRALFSSPHTRTPSQVRTSSAALNRRTCRLPCPTLQTQSGGSGVWGSPRRPRLSLVESPASWEQRGGKQHVGQGGGGRFCSLAGGQPRGPRPAGSQGGLCAAEGGPPCGRPGRRARWRGRPWRWRCWSQRASVRGGGSEVGPGPGASSCRGQLHPQPSAAVSVTGLERGSSSNSSRAVMTGAHVHQMRRRFREDSVQYPDKSKGSNRMSVTVIEHFRICPQ